MKAMLMLMVVAMYACNDKDEDSGDGEDETDTAIPSDCEGKGSIETTFGSVEDDDVEFAAGQTRLIDNIQVSGSGDICYAACNTEHAQAYLSNTHCEFSVPLPSGPISGFENFLCIFGTNPKSTAVDEVHECTVVTADGTFVQRIIFKGG